MATVWLILVVAGVGHVDVGYYIHYIHMIQELIVGVGALLRDPS